MATTVAPAGWERLVPLDTGDLRRVFAIPLLATIAVSAAGCFGSYPADFPPVGSCIAGLEDDPAAGFDGMQLIACTTGRIWRIDGLAGEGDSCPATTSEKRVLVEESGPLAKARIICLDRQ